jgi:hypothetical protein
MLPSFFKKAPIVIVGVLVIAIGGGGAYYYFVMEPQAQKESAEKQAMKPKVIPAPAARIIPPPPVVASAPKPAIIPPAASAPVPANPQPAPAMPVIAAASEVAPEPAIEPAKQEPAAQKAAVKKSGKKPKAVTTIEPMDNKPVAPATGGEASTERSISGREQTQTPKAAEEAPGNPVPFAPDSESRVIRPKYNDVMTAVLQGDQEGVKQLLDLGWWVDKPGPNGFTPLVAAVMNRDTQMVKLLLDHGAAPSSQALDIARKNKDTDTMFLLVQRGTH